MLTIIGLFPAIYALNPMADQSLSELPNLARQVEPLVQKYGDDQKEDALKAVKALEDYKATSPTPASLIDILRLSHGQDGRLGMSSDTAKQRSALRDNIYKLIAQLKHVEEAKDASEDDKKQAKSLSKKLRVPVEYAPWWVRILSAVCLGVGTMIGYQRIVSTLGQRFGKVHLRPRRARPPRRYRPCSSNLGLQRASGQHDPHRHLGYCWNDGHGQSRLHLPMLSRIVIAWLVTLPVTILIAGGLDYLLESPSAALGP